MSLSLVTKSISTITSLLGLVTISNLVFINSAVAFGVTFDNGDFENSTTSWSTIGDVNTRGIIDGISPISGSSQAIVTNAYQTRVDDVDNSSNALSFNQSTINPVDADTIATNHTGQDLQTFLGLPIDALSIDRNPVVAGNPRTSKEGSGLYQDIVIDISSTDVTNGTNGFIVSFNWAYLTNDGTNSFLGNQDFGFLTLYDTASAPGAIEVLADSSGSIVAPAASDDFVQTQTTFYDINNVATRSVTGLAEGSYTYRVGFGVVDVDGSDRSSALLVDNFNVQEIPFEFSPSFGLLLMAGVFGLDYLRRKHLSKSESNLINR